MTSKALKARILDFIQSGKNFCTNENTCQLDKFNIEQSIDRGEYSLKIVSFQAGATVLRSPFSFAFKATTFLEYGKANADMFVQWQTLDKNNSKAENFFKKILRVMEEVFDPEYFSFGEQIIQSKKRKDILSQYV